MATLEERKAKIEADATAKLEALAAEEVRRDEVARLDAAIEAIREKRAALMAEIEPLLTERAKLVPKRPRTKREV